jgi:hypothetical protein
MSVDPRALALKKRALTELTKAFEESRGELSCDWVRTGDLDLASLRDDPGLGLVLRRYCSGSDAIGSDDYAKWRAVMRRYEKCEKERQLHGYPARPWGDPERRATGWAVCAVAGIEALVLYLALLLPFDTGAGWSGSFALIALTLLAIFRSILAWREARRSDAEEQARRLVTTGGRP